MFSDKRTLASIIDTLTMSEPTHPARLWRPAFETLERTYQRARAYRRFIVLPLAAIAAITAFVLRDLWTNETTSWRWYIGTPFIAGAVVYFCMTFPFTVFRREARITALLRYYGVKLPAEEIAL